MPRQVCLSMAGPTSQDVDPRVAGGLQRLVNPQILSFGVSSHSFDVDLIEADDCPRCTHRLHFLQLSSTISYYLN